MEPVATEAFYPCIAFPGLFASECLALTFLRPDTPLALYPDRRLLRDPAGVKPEGASNAVRVIVRRRTADGALAWIEFPQPPLGGPGAGWVPATLLADVG